VKTALCTYLLAKTYWFDYCSIVTDVQVVYSKNHHLQFKQYTFYTFFTILIRALHTFNVLY